MQGQRRVVVETEAGREGRCGRARGRLRVL